MRKQNRSDQSVLKDSENSMILRNGQGTNVGGDRYVYSHIDGTKGNHILVNTGYVAISGIIKGDNLHQNEAPDKDAFIVDSEGLSAFVKI
jgi:hypothetical protein